jgi:hypothetical protein
MPEPSGRCLGGVAGLVLEHLHGLSPGTDHPTCIRVVPDNEKGRFRAMVPGCRSAGERGPEACGSRFNHGHGPDYSRRGGVDRQATPPSISGTSIYSPIRHPERSDGSPFEAAARRADPTPCTTTSGPGSSTKGGGDPPPPFIGTARRQVLPDPMVTFQHPAADREQPQGAVPHCHS